MKRVLILSTALLLGTISVSAQITMLNLTQWRVEDGGNDHWYGLMADGQSWSEAYDIALTTEHDSEVGYLATITSHAENDFIFNSIISGVENTSFADEYYLGGFWSETSLSWEWVTGEDFCYTNWARDEPNNPAEDMLGFWGTTVYYGQDYMGGRWNDLQSHHPLWSIVEWGDPATSVNDPYNPLCPEAVIPEPSTILLFALGIFGAGAIGRFR